MRILMLSHSRNDRNAGASRVYHVLEKGLAARGHEVVLLHYEDFKPLKFRPLQKIIDRLFLPNFIAHRSQSIWRDEFDIIMAPSGMGFPVFEKLKAHFPRPLLINHIFGLSFFDHQANLLEYAAGRQKLSALYRFVSAPMTIRWEAKAAAHADLTIVMNDRDLDFLRRGAARQGPILKIAGFVIEEIRGAGDVESLIARKLKSLLWFGSWTARKGIFALPMALDLVMKEEPAATLTIGGAHIPESEIRAGFSAAANERIRVLPQMSVAGQIGVFREHSIFIFPSLSEGFGLALLEAMASGLAVVTTDTGVGGDSLTHGLDCLIVPKASAVHLARAVLRLIRDDGLRRLIAANGRALAREFSEGAMVDRFEAVFAAHRRRVEARP